MTAQEIYERDGFLVACTRIPVDLPHCFEQTLDGAIAPVGTKVVLTERIEDSVALKIHSKDGLHCAFPFEHYHYKAVAE